MKGWGRLGLKTIRYALALRPGIEIRYPLLFGRNSVQNSLKILEEFSTHQQNSNLFCVFLVRILQMRAEFQMHQNSYFYLLDTISSMISILSRSLNHYVSQRWHKRVGQHSSNFVVLSTCYLGQRKVSNN